MGELEIYQSDFEAQVRASSTPSWCYPELVPVIDDGLCERSSWKRPLRFTHARLSAGSKRMVCLIT